MEPLLAARDNALMVKIEAAMARVRSGIAANVAADELQGQAARRTAEDAGPALRRNREEPLFAGLERRRRS